MSGPKSASWSVDENRAVLEEARRQGLATADDLSAQLLGLLARAREARDKYGPTFPTVRGHPPEPPARSASQSTIDGRIAELRVQVQDVETQLVRALAIHETRLLLQDAASRAQASPEDAGPVAIRGDAPNQARARREAEALRILGHLETHVPASTRRSLQDLAQDLVEGTDAGTGESLTLELRLRVQRANQEAASAAQDAARASDLRLRLRGLTGDDVARIDTELARVERAEQRLRAALPDEVELVAAAARRRADQAYVATVMREEFERLGYRVESEFQTLFVEGGHVHLRKPQLKEYRVAIDVAAGSQRMHVRLVRVAVAGANGTEEERRRDRHMEESWCRDFSRLLSAVQARGIAGRVVERVPPGANPIPVIEMGEQTRGRRAAARGHGRSRHPRDPGGIA